MNKGQEECARKEIFITYVTERIFPYIDVLLEKYPFYRYDFYVDGITGVETIINEKYNFLSDRDIRDVFIALRQLQLDKDDISLKSLENAVHAACFRVYFSTDYVKMLIRDFKRVFDRGCALWCWPSYTYTNPPQGFPTFLDMYLYGYPGVVHTDISKWVRGRKIFGELPSPMAETVKCVFHSVALELCLYADAIKGVLMEDKFASTIFYKRKDKIRKIHMEQNGEKFKISKKIKR